MIFPDGKRIILLAKGRLVNLGCAHRPSQLRDEFVLRQPDHRPDRVVAPTRRGSYPVGVYTLPKHLDEKVARLQLKKLNARLTPLTEQQAGYIGVPVEGPYKSEHYRY